MDFKKEFKFVITQFHIIVIIVIGLHFLIPWSLEHLNISFFNIERQKITQTDEKYFEVDLEDHLNIEINSKVSQDISGSIEIISPDIYILRESKSSENNIDNLLSMLSNTPKSRVNIIRHSKKKRKKFGNYAINKRQVTRKVKQKFAYEQILTKDEVFELEKEKLKHNVIALNSKFQKCYLDELSRDDLLTGKISIIIRLNKKNIQFNGIGKNSSIKNLKDCIKTKLNSIFLSKQLRKNTIRFNFNLNGEN